MSCDINFADVSLLLTCDGTNGSTTFLDTSSVGNTMTASGTTTPAVSTADPMFGTGAMNFGSAVSLGVVTCPISSMGPLDLNGDFTIEGWINFDNFTTATAVMSDSSGSNIKWSMVQIGGGVLSFQMRMTAGPFSCTSPSFAAGSWQAWAVVRHGNTLTLYINGVGGTPTTITGTVVATEGTLRIGSGVGQAALAGQLDEIRITNGIARYTANYTPGGPFLGTCAATVPNVVGEILTTAESNITAALLTVGTVTTASSPTVPAGHVISQSPSGGASAMQGDSVDLVDSTGPVPGVPTRAVYGKFVGSPVFPPTLLIDAKGIKPRIYMPKENVTVKT